MDIAAELCAAITARLDGLEHGGLRIYTYGARGDDIELVPPPVETLVAVVQGDELRWYEVSVREHRPQWVDIAYDPEVRAELACRAGLPNRTP